MAGTVTRTMVFSFGDTTLTADYTFAYGDEHDAVDWDGPREAIPVTDAFDLVGNIVVNVTGPGTIHGTYYRLQGNSRNPWREADLTAANTPMLWVVGRGPNPRTVGELRGGQAKRVA
jgi:hypothetical protein